MRAAVSARYYVKRWRWVLCEVSDTPRARRPQQCPHEPRCQPDAGGFGRLVTGWVGPVRSLAQARREVAAWLAAGWQSDHWPATAERKAEVDAWQRAANRRHGRRP